MKSEMDLDSGRLPVAVIANITGQMHLAHRMYGTFQIAGRGDGQEFALTRVTGRTAVMDYGDKRTLPLAISAREIAEDICREINSDAGDKSFLGVFVCAGETPTAEELRAAGERLDEFDRALVASADREWERSHSFLFIHDLQRRAAARLGLEKEWHYQARETMECPGCGTRVKPGVAVCKSCGAILNREKALALGLAQALPVAAPVVGGGVSAGAASGAVAAEKIGARR
jgi:ribosomal protein L32